MSRKHHDVMKTVGFDWKFSSSRKYYYIQTKTTWFHRVLKTAAGCEHYSIREHYHLNVIIKQQIKQGYLPGKALAISAHLFPCIRWACIRANSSTNVQASLFISGFKWLCHLKGKNKMVHVLYIAFHEEPTGWYKVIQWTTSKYKNSCIIE